MEPILSLFICSKGSFAHTTAGGDCDLDRVPSWLAHVFQVQGFVRCFVVAPLDRERRGINADLDRCRPVGVHLTVFVVVALKLQLQVRSAQTKHKLEISSVFLETSLCKDLWIEAVRYFV